MTTKRVFISQPMNDRTDLEIEQTKEKAVATVQSLLGENIEVIDSYIKVPPKGAKPLWLLAKSIELLSTADVAYFTKGWENMRGCRVEYMCAQEYGIEIIEEVKT